VPRQLEIVLDRRDLFAVKVAFLPDPDEGRAATREHSASWGSLEIWVNGHNLCAHIEQGEPVASVHWYLLPFLQWLASNWDFLLHEERLPIRNAGATAWTAMRRTNEAPPALPADEAERWELRWHQWWERHCLVACREGGLLPNLFIRRWRDDIEFSWGIHSLAGAPEHFRFDAFPGCGRLAPDEVAYVLFGVLDRASRHLLDEMPDSPVFAQLVRDVAALETSDQRHRLGLISGVLVDDQAPDQVWDWIQQMFPANLSLEARKALFGPSATKLVVQGSCPAALMFGSLSPTVVEPDVRLLAEKLVRAFTPDGESKSLRQLVRDEPVGRTDDTAWEQGYRLAEELLDEIGNGSVDESPVDMDRLYQDLGITVQEVFLSDCSIRAVAIAGRDYQPTVLLNTSYLYRDEEPQRFTLAHELCHILHDRSYGAHLAMASGPWAPVDVEKRANAFAAMLLMPDQLVETIVRRLTMTLDSSAEIWEIANRLRTSFSSTLEHLCNRGFIDEAVRDQLRNPSPNLSPNLPGSKEVGRD
jgi:Zn-dependent peptidase ImmA (M78 family)